MNVLVYDVAAETAGVLSILNDFRQSLNTLGKDIQWVFVVGKASMEPSENIRVIAMPEAKKSWFHRLYYDCVVMPRFIKEHQIDVVLSLQNVCIPFVSVPQYVYMHQSLAFEQYRFSPWKKEERILFVHQNVIARFIFSSIKKARRVIVQTHDIKHKCQQKLGVSEDKFIVVPPTVSTELVQPFQPESLKGDISFFYPATPFPYKNHEVLFRAAHELIGRGCTTFRLVLTVAHVQELSAACQKLYSGLEQHVEFTGFLPRTDIMQRYTRSVLLFPSVMETFGLPMLEARLTGTPVIASDLGFSHEILDDYANARFFRPKDWFALADAMQAYIEHKAAYSRDRGSLPAASAGWADIIDAIRNNQ